MKIIVNTFSTVRSACGFIEKLVELTDKSSVGDVLQKLFIEYNGLAGMKGNLLLAVNEEYCNESKILHEGDKLAIFPPVSGG